MSTEIANDNTMNDATSPSGWSLAAKIGLWVTSAGSAGLLVSLLFHVLLGFAALTIVVSGGGGGGRGEPGAGMSTGAVVAETTLTELSVSDLATEDPTDLSALPMIEAPSVDLTTLAGGSGLQIELPSATPGSMSGLAGSGLGGGSGSGAGFEEGIGDLGGGGGGGGARFFGVEARGSRFVYVVDVSGSMQGDRLQALKKELATSLDGLLTASSFLVVLFNSESVPLGGRVKWIEATEPAKRRIEEMLGKVVAGGGTQPEDAFDMAFSLKPRPDAIYFMTDGLFDSGVAERVAKLNREDRRTVPIHCIAFGTRDAEALMRQIAQTSGGSYTYIAGP